jgi:hypothetical protein
LAQGERVRDFCRYTGDPEAALSYDTKVGKLTGIGLYGYLDCGHMRPRRAIMAPGDEPLYSALFPLYHGLDIAVATVPHPAH